VIKKVGQFDNKYFLLARGEFQAQPGLQSGV
jgi:hypothetical protein